MFDSRHIVSIRGAGVICLLVALLSTACGGGGGGTTGDTTGEDTLPVILDLQTPLGLQGTRGTGSDVSLVYHIRDREFDPADVEVQFGVDTDRSGVIDDDEFQAATSGAGGEGTTGLAASPGIGSVHTFVWSSLKDVVSGRHVTQDYVYTETGRIARDDFGEPVFQSFPGTVVRMRPLASGVFGAWRYSAPFNLNNNNRPSVTVGAVTIPPEGTLEGTVNEQVVLSWKAIDPDGDPVTVAVDWVSVPDGYDPQGKTSEELDTLPWTPATSGTLGEGTYQLPASPFGVNHEYAWDSIADTGTVNQWTILRFRPIDGKLEVGNWFYSHEPFHLDNYTVFTNPDSVLTTALGGARAVLLRDSVESVLIAGGRATDGGVGRSDAELFFPGRTQTTKGVIAAIEGGMNKGRTGHTMTRLLDGRVLVTGGVDETGTVTATAEIFDPSTRTFTLLSSTMSAARAGHTATLLNSGDVLVAGGVDGDGNLLRSGDVYRVGAGSFAALSSSMWMAEGRTEAGATLLPGGRVLVAGGRGNAGPLATVELYDPALSGFAVTDVGNDMNLAREGLSLTGTLDANFAAVAAGATSGPAADTLERFDWRTDGFTMAGVRMRSGRSFHASALLGTGRILLAGGQMDESGALSGTADLYDPSTDTMDVPNGDLISAVRDPAVAILDRGRPVLFGGFVSAAATDSVQVFTPDGGFNERPLAQIADMLGSVEPWSFGVRIRWRAIDAEGDPVRVVCQYRVKPSASDDSGLLPDSIKDKWLPATMADQTVLGEVSSGLTALSSRSDFVDTVDNPIDAPDIDPGEHLFVWETSTDVPKGDYDNVFFRIFVYGAEEGTGVESQRFSISKNAPVIARIVEPLSTFGNVVVPFYLQDSDQGELARLEWSYGVDLNDDGKIVEADGETWEVARHATVGSTVGGTTYYDVGSTDVVTGSKNPDPNNDLTVAGIPWGKKHYLVWDSVYDLGAPATSRNDVILRVVPYDYPAGSPGNESLGIEQTLSGFTLTHDPDGLVLSGWQPSYTTASGTYVFEGVRLDEPLVFDFSAAVDPNSNLTGAIQVVKESTGQMVAGFYDVSGNRVTFYPQAQEVPARSDVLVASTGYTVNIHAYDPADRTHAIVERLGADPTDTNARFLLLGWSSTRAFRTGTTMVPDSAKPNFTTRVLPSADSGVSPSSAISVEFDDRIMAGTVNTAGLRAVAMGVPGVESVINGTFALTNVVDRSGPGGAIREYSVLTFTPDVALPAGLVTIEIRMATSLKDLAGNSLSSAATSSFTTAVSTATVPGSHTEEFDDKDQRDDALTTAFWGIYDPVDLGNSAGTGVAGKLSGLYDFGDGSDGPLDLTGGDASIDTDVQSEWNYTSVFVPHGRTLTIHGRKPAIIRVQGDVVVQGRIDAAGRPGDNTRAYDYLSTPQSGSSAQGGRGGPGGGDGGGTDDYYWKQTTSPKTYDGEKGYGASSDSVGTAASSWIYVNGGSNYPYIPGGGGAAHANDGLDGGIGYSSYSSNFTLGYGGDKFGFSDLRSGLEAGSGGGSGGGYNQANAYTSGTYTYEYLGHASGGAGGGGGGAIRITASGRITVNGAGAILANGGKGGNGLPYPFGALRYRYQYTNYVYPNIVASYTGYVGGGGGGSGGSVHLQAGNGFDLHGKVDVSGGKGGEATNYSTSYDMHGGDGGDGRLLLEAPDTISLNDAADLRGCLTVVSASSVSGGSGTTDWTVSGSVTVDTDSGSGAPSGVYSGGKFTVDDFTVNSGSSLRLVGSQPFRLYAKGNVKILGTVDAKGTDGSGYTSSGGLSSSSGFRCYTVLMGGAGGPGGGDGGNNGKDSSTYYQDPPPGLPGYGPSIDPKADGKGAGQEGVQKGPAVPYFYRYMYTTYGYQYTYYYYYLSGGGGGGGSMEPGEDAPWTFRYTSLQAGGRDAGKGGDSVFSSPVVDEGAITGGAGGGGGANAGAHRSTYQYLNTTYGVYSTSSQYYYSYGPPSAGGGGGGGVLIVASGKITLSGAIDVQGGAGGERYYSSYSYVWYSGAGGGGGGGNVCLKANSGFDLSGALIDARGGVRGKSYATGSYNEAAYAYGGEGGRGAITLIAGAGKEPEILNAGNANLGDAGTVATGTFSLTQNGISKWQDSGATVPTYTGIGAFGTAIATLYVEAAQSDPDTGLADPSKTTGWKKVSELSALSGYRWYRFWVKLEGTTVAGKAPEVERVTVTWTWKN